HTILLIIPPPPRSTLFPYTTLFRSKVVFLENVKNLVSHDKGNTFKTIISILEDKLGYKTFTKVLNSMTHANIPQNRERIFIVARSEEHTSELQSRENLVCRLLLEKK